MKENKNHKKIPPRWDGEGQWYFITFATIKRESIFREENNCNSLLEAFKISRSFLEFRVGALVILPDHIHVLLQTLGFTLIEDIIDSVKRNSLRSICGKNQKSFWQKRFLDHRIRNEEDFYRHYEYIRLNGFKHQYVKENEEYRWCFLQENPFR